MKRLILLHLIGALLVAPLSAKGPVVGNKAIDFTLKTFDGQTVSLSQYRGKVVLLDFWASWCGPCKEEMPFLSILQKSYGKAGLVVLAVNIDKERKNALKFMDHNAVQLTPLWDAKMEVVSSYDIAKMPTTFIIDRHGVIRFMHLGFKAEQFSEYKRQIEKLLQEGRKK